MWTACVCPWVEILAPHVIVEEGAPLEMLQSQEWSPLEWGWYPEAVTSSSSGRWRL